MTCIIVPTPASIKEDLELDVFADTMSGYSSSAWYDDLYTSLWARYRHRMITSCNVDLWEELLQDRVDELMVLYKIYLDAFYSLTDREKTDIITDSGTATTWYQSENMPDTPAENIPDMEGDPAYLSLRTKSKTLTEGARAPLLSITQAFENRMELIRKFTDDVGSVFLNRWR